ncbi:MAG: hypothetical protein GX483_03890 [Actinomycetaceae bacterium]|nr:hypothetical protein [Actinomycetaceae bacterium]
MIIRRFTSGIAGLSLLLSAGVVGPLADEAQAVPYRSDLAVSLNSGINFTSDSQGNIATAGRTVQDETEQPAPPVNPEEPTNQELPDAPAEPQILELDAPHSGWLAHDGYWYWFADSTTPVINSWLKFGDYWYWLGADGKMAVGLFTDSAGNLYYAAESGAIYQGGWFERTEGWYYANPGGDLATGWQRIKGYWYYLDPAADGRMVRGWNLIDGTWYRLSNSGAMLTGWTASGNDWYYLHSWGGVATGWQWIGGYWYYLDPTADGRMHTGWLQEGDIWYYLTASGAMATNTTVINGRASGFAANGAWLGYAGYTAPNGYLQVTDRITPLGGATNTLTSGFNGVKVRLVQQALGIWYTTKLATMDTQTINAVKSFQERWGLPVTGVVDKATWDMLDTGYAWDVDAYQATPMPLSATRSQRIEQLITYAQNQIGSSYTWGGAGWFSLGFDCSGLVLQALYSAGIDPYPITVLKHAEPTYRTSQELYKHPGLMHVPFSERQRGDIVFYGNNGVVFHVGIYIGNDQIIHTDWMGRPARYDSVYAYTPMPEVVRPFP